MSDQQPGVGVEQRRVEVCDPFTGEAVDLSDLAFAADYLDTLRRWKIALDQATRDTQDAILDQMSVLGQGTVRVGRAQLRRVPKVDYEYDHEELLKLLDMGLPEQRFQEVVRDVVDRKVSRTALKQVAASNPEYAKVIERATTKIDRPASVEVQFSEREME